MINMLPSSDKRLATHPNLLPNGGVAKVDLKDCVPDLLVLTPTVVNKLLDGGASVSLSDSNPMIVVVR